MRNHPMVLGGLLLCCFLPLGCASHGEGMLPGLKETQLQRPPTLRSEDGLKQDPPKAGTSTRATSSESYEELKIFAEVLSKVQKHSLKEIPLKFMVTSAITGMLKAVDPRSGFMTPEMYNEFQAKTGDQSGGVGIQIGPRNNQLTVIAPIDQSPAQRAGVKPGDRIVEINGEPTENLSLMEAVRLLRGPVGSKLSLTLERKGLPESLTFELVREIERIESVQAKAIDNNIGYIRLAIFQKSTARDLDIALQTFRAGDIRGLILDLRNNPGGLLSAAIEVSEKFLSNGKIIVSIQARDGRKDEYISKAKELPKNLPVAILVNKGSAAASEIVAGALQDWEVATVVGTPTFGRGTIQTIFPLSNGSGLRLTTANYFTPKGHAIDETSKIQPNIVVEEQEGIDAPLAAAKAHIEEILQQQRQAV